ncbi:hypothetical protein AURDEDRAFT_174527 [Auricularia subglabra TFB-10046 SS5]|uniref:Uncharacterized protein n=1 Tax=Auricularia subglabra (strain TFB-10046 / SS5) TaxID=717982 RepID=J0LG23_AURST|nr:hypothetical protein AURDEDRAFT_174527 [Auricularia subglabra TFB-10046 SS5]
MPQELDADPFANLLVMYTLPEALRVAADLVAVEAPTMIAFEAVESTAEIGEMWTLAVSAQTSAKSALEGAENDLKAADAMASARARETAQKKANKKIEIAQGELEAAVEDQEKMARELGQSFVDWHESIRKAEDAKREAHNAALKKQNAEDLAEAKRKRKNKEKKTNESEASEGRSKAKDGDSVDGTYRETPCALCEHGGFACYDKLDAKGKACAACAASKQPCWIPATGELKNVLNGITERLDSVDGKLDALEEKYEDFATSLNTIKDVLQDQGKCLASLVALQAGDQRALEDIAEKLDVAPSKSAGKRREKRKVSFKPMVVTEAVHREGLDEDRDKDEGPSKKRRKVEKAKSRAVVLESEDEEAAETAKGKEKGREKEKEKSSEGPVDETLWGD